MVEEYDDVVCCVFVTQYHNLRSSTFPGCVNTLMIEAMVEQKTTESSAVRVQELLMQAILLNYLCCGILPTLKEYQNCCRL